MDSAALLIATNVARANARLQPFGNHATLQIAAQQHAEWMAANRTMSHTGDRGSNFMQRIYAAGPYPAGTGAAENIAWGATSAEDCVAMWMASAGHRANVLRSTYISAGFGAAKASNGRWYCCGLYGAAKPSDEAPLPSGPDPKPAKRTLLDWLLLLLRGGK